MLPNPAMETFMWGAAGPCIFNALEIQAFLEAGKEVAENN